MTTVQKLTFDQEILLLQFWALSVEIARTVPAEIRQSINSLQPAIELASGIPVAIGWDDETNASTLLQTVVTDAPSGKANS